MRISTTLLLAILLFWCAPALGQDTEFVWDVPLSDDPTAPFSYEMTGGQFSGGFAVNGPFDLDDDGQIELLVPDFSGGQRVHVLELQSGDTWELVYSTPYHEPASFSTAGARYATGGDLDGDGNGEIIFVSGHNWAESENNPVTSATGGIFIYENVGDNDFGSEVTAAFGVESFAEAGEPEPPYVKADNFSTFDIDGDDQEELLWPNDASFPWDEWYVLSVTNDLGSGFATLSPELRLAARAADTLSHDPLDRGGGSTYAVNPADLDGDGTYEISFHAWNSFSFHNGDVLGPDSYAVPDEGTEPYWYHASGNDDLSWFNGVVVDINQDGDDEIFYPREYGFEDDENGNRYEYVSVMNYEDGEDVLQITSDQLVLDLVGPLTAYGIDAGDVNDDGWTDLIGAGRGFSGADYTAGRQPAYLRVAQFTGGEGADPEDAANYDVTEITFPITEYDTLFNVVHRDSLGEATQYYESAGGIGAYPPGQPEEISPTRVKYLGDPDDDGMKEVAAAFFGINDSLQVIDEVWNADSLRYERTVRETFAAPARPMIRVFEFDATALSIDRVGTAPDAYRLHANHPNPFRGQTSFAFTLQQDERVTVKIYDVLGREVRTLVDAAFFPAGARHEVTWDGTDARGIRVASGTYLYSIEGEGFRKSRMMVLVK